MDLEKAAKYLIVAWIKEWRMRTLLNAIDGHGGEVTQEIIDRVHAKYPFMPNILHAYIAGKGQGILMRPYVSNLSKKLSDLLWDAKDNETRLSHYTLVMKLKGENLGRMQGLSKEDRAEQSKDIRYYKSASGGYKQSRHAFKLAQGRDWFTIK
jgi:hypothetical protein